MKKRIFISYSHDEHVGFVGQLKSDLGAAGHEVWLDVDSIRAGAAWHDSIERGVKWAAGADQDGWMLFIMTQRSVREGSVCVNEIVCAREHHLRILPIMVEDCELPVLVNDRQVMDMRDCTPLPERRARYAERFALLLRALQEVDSGEVAGARCTFVRAPRLKSPSQWAFVDREAELEELRRWLGDRDRRLTVVVGPPGVGKSALLSQMCDELESGALADVAHRGMYVSCRELFDQPLSLFSVYLANLLPAEEGATFLQGWQPSSIGRPFELQAADLLGRFRYPSLLILENLEMLLDDRDRLAVPEHRAFFGMLLERRHHLRVLATSRRAPDIEGHPADHYVLYMKEGLAEADAIRLFREIGGERLSRDSDSTLRKAASRFSGNPLMLRQAIVYMSRRPSQTLESLLADRKKLYGQELFGLLLSDYFSALTPAERQVAQALAVLDRPEPLDAVVRLLARVLEAEETGSVLDRLVVDAFVDFDQASGACRLLPLWRGYVENTLPDEGSYSRATLHGLAADYYAGLLSSFESIAQGAGSYLGCYRLEQTGWQEAIAAWLTHLAQAGDLAAAQLSIAKVYFDAFWWWGIYIPFAFCERLLAALREAAPLRREPAVLDLLEQFHAAWPLERHYRERAHCIDRWAIVQRTLTELQARLRCAGPVEALAGDGDRLCVRALIALALGQASSFLGDGSSVACFREALHLAQTAPDLAWCVSRMRYRLAQELARLGEDGEALEHLHTSWQEASADDHEVRASITRLLGDIYWSQGDRRRSWRAMTLATLYTHRYHGAPQLPDEFTIEFNLEMAERVAERLTEWLAVDPAGCVRAAEELAMFWRDSAEGTPNLLELQGAEVLAAWLAEAGQATLRHYVLPPLPTVGDRAYAEKAERAVQERATQVAEMLGEVLP